MTFLKSDGASSVFPNPRNFGHYAGHVLGLMGSSVIAHMEEDSTKFTARIFSDSGVYVVEPLSLYKEYYGNDSMLIYQLKDIETTLLSNEAQYFIDPLITLRNANLPVLRNHGKRTATNTMEHNSAKKLCGLIFIADYAFYVNIGDKSGPKTTKYIIKLFDRLNLLYLSAKFLDDHFGEMTGYGFFLQEIIIHESLNSTFGHYNAALDVDGKQWTATALLQAFSRASLKPTCLAHLLSYKRIAEGILGMSWLASSEPKKLGGICSQPFRQMNGMIYLNTGWTTYVDYSGQQLVSILAELITAHELGHSWGADHDPDTNECNPTASSHGKYLMYTYSVSGYAENNGKFSPCSLRTIGACLIARAPLCFVEPSMALLNLCGNSRLDDDEECDAGRIPNDPCCTSDCRLRKEARCSPWNHGCCTPNCQIAPEHTVCAQPSSSNPCLGHGECDGNSFVCPGPKLLSGGLCDEYGQCHRGKCRPFCELIGLETCICDNVEHSCYICCLYPMLNPQTNENKTCHPVLLTNKNVSFLTRNLHSPYVTTNGQVQLRLPLLSTSFSSELDVKYINNITYFIYLQDYRPCLNGYCRLGKCIASRTRRISRFWALVYYSKQKNFGNFLWDNLIWTIIVSSLIIWIPLSVCVSCSNSYAHRTS